MARRGAKRSAISPDWRLLSHRDFGIHASTLEIKEYNGEKCGHRSGRRTKLQTGMSVLLFFAAVGGAQPATGAGKMPAIPGNGPHGCSIIALHIFTCQTERCFAAQGGEAGTAGSAG